MFGFRKPIITNTSSTTTSDSDDDTRLKDTYCVIVDETDKCSIYSNKSNSHSILRYSQGSFSFHTVNGCVVLQLHKMFLWRIINKSSLFESPERQVDSAKIRAYFSKFMSQSGDILICVYPDRITFPRDNETGFVNTSRYCLVLLETFNKLYTDIARKYNTNERVDEMIRKCADILCFISNA